MASALGPSIAELLVPAGQLAAAVATVVVAWLVYQHGRSQSERAQVLAEAQHQLQFQNFRIALLDRRLQVFRKIDRVWHHWVTTSQPDPEILQLAAEAVEEAQMVFDHAVVMELRSVANSLARIQIYHARSEERRRHGDQERADRDMAKGFSAQDELFDRLQPLRDALQRATRIEEPG